MTRSASSTYDDDFFAWTQEQAAALRRLSPDAIGNAIDLAHVAEEIEDLGKRDLREVTSYLARLLGCLIKIDGDGTSVDRPHWASEAVGLQDDALAAFTPSMRRLIDPEKIWQRGRKHAQRYFEEASSPLVAAVLCPVSIDELLAEHFDLDAALAKVAAARAADGRA